MANQPLDTGASILRWSGFEAVTDYWTDAFQRSILCLDVLRQRGNIAKEHNAALAPNVLQFKAELLVDGRTLDRPVNYVLVRIPPPEGTVIAPEKRPFIVVDPRAGHGPGIGGMKQDSQIGVAMEAGHPCYFVGFLPNPMPGQTIDDVCKAEAFFVKTVAARHPDAEGKPVLIGNCQAGWQLMIMAALNPDLCGPIMLAGSPLSYWAGVRGKNPLRYLGGTLGGTWMTALAGDLGNGIFDGADLVRNFESMNPANTLWKKPYNVYAKVDTEVERFLDFETWWGSPVLLNAEEMQWIADNLFVGNRLTEGSLRSNEGVRIDLRNIRSPVIVFCSWGDDITPPQQALGWITDLYDKDREIIANGQTIVYTMHQSIGHLGIFVSGKVATREHEELTSAMDLIDLAPPGLYEAVITNVDENTANPELIQGRYLFRLEKRSLADIRALGNNEADDQLRFATAARVSEVNLALYRRFLAPVARATTTAQTAEVKRKLHPSRLRFNLFSDENPLMQPVKALAETIKQNRAPVPPGNPLLAMERMTSDWIVTCFGAAAAARDTLQERMFLAVYGSPLLQALVGFSPGSEKSLQRAERDLLREANEARLQAELEPLFETGSLPDAFIRALVYIRLTEGNIDERGFAVVKAVRAARPVGMRLSQPQLKEAFRNQFLLLIMDQDRAVRALPALLPDDPAIRREALAALHRVVAVSGRISDEGARRLAEVELLFDAGAAAETKAPLVPSAAAAHKPARLASPKPALASRPRTTARKKATKHV
jgi:pimeloyl-ACP methyl ester carboxylesterase